MFYYKYWPNTSLPHFSIWDIKRNYGFCLTCSVSVYEKEQEKELTSIDPILEFVKKHPDKLTHNADKLKKVIEELLAK